MMEHEKLNFIQIGPYLIAKEEISYISKDWKNKTLTIYLNEKNKSKHQALTISQFIIEQDLDDRFNEAITELNKNENTLIDRLDRLISKKYWENSRLGDEIRSLTKQVEIIKKTLKLKV